MGCPERLALRAIKVRAEASKAFWKRAKEISDKGVTDYAKIVERISKDAQVTPEFVHKILTEPKAIRNITDQMWRDQIRHRAIVASAKDSLRQLNTSSWKNAVGKVYNAPRDALVFGHGLAFPFTHARDVGLTDPSIFKDAVGRAIRYRTDDAAWQSDMHALQLRDSYRAAKGAGLEVDPKTEPVGILSSRMKGWSRRSFDALKIMRLDLWDKYAGDLKDAPKDVMQDIARQINHATGSVELRAGSGVLGKLMFAPKLYFAKRMAAYVDPIKYLFKDGPLTPQERFAVNLGLRRWGKLVAINTGLVGANAAFNQFVLGQKNVNMTDPTKSDWMQMKLGGMAIPLSPMMQVLRMPVMASFMLAQGKSDKAATAILKDVFSAAHPTLHALLELTTGREYVLTGRRIAPPGIAQVVNKMNTGEFEKKSGEYLPRQTLTEYGTEKFTPLPIGSFVGTFYQSLRDNGLGPSLAKSALSAMLSGAGMHAHSESETKKPSPAEKQQNAKFQWY